MDAWKNIPDILSSLAKPIVFRISKVGFVRSAIADRADLSAFRRPPDLRVLLGVSAIGLSYLLGWPLIGLLGIAAVHYQQAAIVVVGGPLAYGISHLVFLAGMYLAGAKYSWIFFRWAVCQGMARLMAHCGLPLPSPSLPDVPVVAGHDEKNGRSDADGFLPLARSSHSGSRGQHKDHGKG